MMPQTVDAYNRAVAASEATLGEDGDAAAHAERVAALDKLLLGNGLDLGQVARGALHGNRDWQSQPQPPRDAVSDQCRAFLRRLRLV
jgi:hypothetical protein